MNVYLRSFALVLIFALAGWAPAAQKAKARGVEPAKKDLVYGTVGGQPIKLDLYLPKDQTKPVPLLIFVHGGGWISGSKDALPAFGATALDLGFAVASVQYRLTSQAGQWGGAPVTFPAQIHDVKGAVRYLRAHAPEYNIDPDRFAAWGTSAGGHLVALLATSAGVEELEGDVGGNRGVSSRIQACVDYYGPTDMMKRVDDVTTPPGISIDADAPDANVSRLMGHDQPGQGIRDLKNHLEDPNPPYPRLRHLMEIANPITFVKPGMPPIFIGQGTMDPRVPVKQSLRLKEALEATGNRVELSLAEGYGHGGDLGTETTTAALKFLCEVLKPEAKDKVSYTGTAKPAGKAGKAKKGKK